MARRLHQPAVGESASEHGGTDFFVSYTRADRRWAEWIAWELEEAGFTTRLQAWDFTPGTNFVAEMDRAARTTKRTIAVLSPAYLTSLYAKSEWAAAVARDPSGQSRILIPVRVKRCRPTGLLAQIVYLDLVDRDKVAARQALLEGLHQQRLKPATPPLFPTGRRHGASPVFPGTTPPSVAQAGTSPRRRVALWYLALFAVLVAATTPVVMHVLQSDTAPRPQQPGPTPQQQGTDLSSCGELHYGSQGTCVTVLQMELSRDNPQHPLATDGIFGSSTQAAVTRYQRAHGLKADGVAGPQTERALQGEFSSGNGG